MTSFRLAHLLAACSALSAVGAFVSTFTTSLAATVTWTLASAAFCYMAHLDTKHTRRYRAYLRQQRADRYYQAATSHENRLGVK